MNLTDQEKEELFADFLLRISQMDRADKRVSAAQNNSAMKNLRSYYDDITGGINKGRTEENTWLWRKYDGWWYFAGDGLYDAFCAIRKTIPYIVGVKRALDGTRPKTKSEGYKKTYVLDPEKDQEEADKIGKALMDTMFKYLKEE